MGACHVPGNTYNCSSAPGQSTVIVVVNTDGSGIHAVTHGEVGTGGQPGYRCHRLGPTWSQDGSWIAFERVSAPTTGIYKVHADGSGLTQMISDSAPANNYGGLVCRPTQ